MSHFQIVTVSPNNGFFCRDRIGYLEVGKVEIIRKARLNDSLYRRRSTRDRSTFNAKYSNRDIQTYMFSKGKKKKKHKQFLYF